MLKRTLGVVVVALALGGMLSVPAGAVDPDFTGRFPGTIHRVSGPPRICGRNQTVDWRIGTENAHTRHVRNVTDGYRFTLKYRRHAWRGDDSAGRWDFHYVLRYHDHRQIATGSIVARQGRLARCEYAVELFND